MCNAYDMSYHNQETKHKKVCAVWGKTGQTGFTQLTHKTVKTQRTTHSPYKHATQTNIESLRTFRVHYTHCSTQYKSSQVQHIDKVQQIIITDPNLSTNL
jgi:hypothetical protein